jgi:hydroxypyruvate reductase
MREDLRVLHQAALVAADPAAAVRRALFGPAATGTGHRIREGEKVLLIAAGKAAAGMAAGAFDLLGNQIVAGLVVHPHGDPRAERTVWPTAIRTLGAGHPLPDTASLVAGETVTEMLAARAEGTSVLVLLSGGASALLEQLPPEITLDELRAVTLALQRAGADIAALNTVRRGLSRLKGGGLARLAAPARLLTLALADVAGEAPEAIGSGPTVPSPTGPAEALAVLARRGLLAAVPGVTAFLERAAAARAAESPAAAEETPRGEYRIVGSNRRAVAAVAVAAGECGFDSRIVATALAGEAREVGAALAAEAIRARERLATRGARPLCLVQGGETTVTVHGNGRGGRNQEVALGAARVLAGQPKIALLAVATDGIDGNSRAAGALATGDTLARAAALGLSADTALANNDAEPFFDALGDLWLTGRTGTNVNDLAIALVYPGGEA